MLNWRKVPDLVSEPMIGDIRYQWWRDVIEEVFSGAPVRKHEISTPLAKMIKDCRLSRFHLDRLIDGRARDLDPEPFADIKAAAEYCRATSGELIRLAAYCVSDDVDDAAVMKAGEAWGLAGLARAWRFYKSSMLSNLEFGDICNAAQDTYAAAKEKLNPVIPDLIPAIGYVSLVPQYIRRLKRPNFDPSEDILGYSPLAKQIRLTQTVLTGRL